MIRMRRIPVPIQQSTYAPNGRTSHVFGLAATFSFVRVFRGEEPALAPRMEIDGKVLFASPRPVSFPDVHSLPLAFRWSSKSAE